MKIIVRITAELIGRCKPKKIFKENRNNSVFDFVSVINIEFALVVFKNNKEKQNNQAKKKGKG